ncbi:RNA 2',3'-cyclic phosphodiesterase [Candidatus Margulisiibacteriota bacterium]
MRTFISVELPDEVKQKIAELIEELKKTGANVRWVKPENLHITLKFLGEVDDKKLDKLIAAATKAAAGTGSFKARFTGLGTFPAGKSPRVIWVGTAEGGDELCTLAKALEETGREFRPHITIGRVRKLKGIEYVQDKEFGAMVVDRISIMSSTLTPNGPVYKKLGEVQL